MATPWRTLRVFISSTFRDMHERDYLVRVVFPELRERCAKRRLHLVDVDLGWAQLIVLEGWLSSALKSIALAQLRGGDVQEAIRTANLERSGRLSLLRSLAEVLADTGDKENFKRLLLSCADEIKTANGMCTLLSGIYPQQLGALAEAVVCAERSH